MTKGIISPVGHTRPMINTNVLGPEMGLITRWTFDWTLVLPVLLDSTFPPSGSCWPKIKKIKNKKQKTRNTTITGS